MSANRRRRFNVDDLFADTRPQAAGVSDLVNAKEIRLDRIQADPDQPRREIEDAALAELAASIEAEGILQPIAVRYDEEHDVYVVIHGERRWRAARMAGLDTIPAIVRDIPTDRILLQQLMENIVREDLNALDRAAALRALKDQLDDAPWDQVARAVGIRRSRLFQLLGTEKLSPTVQQALRDGRISEKQTRSVQRLPDDVQEELGRRIVAGDITPQEVDRAARALLGASTTEDAGSILNQYQATRAAHPKGDRAASTIRRQVRSLRRTLDAGAGELPEDLYDEIAGLSHQLQEILKAR